jgi:hypothetical protein
MMKPVRFFEFTRLALSERLQSVKDGVIPPRSDLRHFFYEVRNRFLRKYPGIPNIEFDSKAKESTKFYASWSRVVTDFCAEHAVDFDIDPKRWWLIRDKMNLFAKGKAICESESGQFIVDSESRGKVAEGCSFILVCEKVTVSEELVKNLREEGYKLSLVSSGGKDPADVKEALIQAVDDLEVENFYVLHLHDFDLYGVEMYFELRSHYDKVIDVGVNSRFLEVLGNMDRRLVEEQSLNKSVHLALQESIKNHARFNPEYTDDDYQYMQGESVGDKEWRGKRIEIDAVHVQYGIKPFVDYIESRLEDIDCWDLTRIGIDEQELEEPPNEYRSLISKMEDDVGRAYGEKLDELSENYNEVLKVIQDTLTQPPEYSELRHKFVDTEATDFSSWQVKNSDGTSYKYDQRPLKNIHPLKEKYSKQISREWRDDYKGDLDERVNDKLECWDEDVSTAEEDIENIVEELQDNLDEDKANDSDLEEFKKKLESIEWGEEELDAIEVPDPIEEIRRVINALEEFAGQKEAAPDE